MNGAQAMAARLVDHGVEVIFALPGEENLAFVEAVADTDIELVVVRHEQHAAFMAAAHGRLTGRPGVCLATLGPGALNLFTGLAHAQLGGMPVIAITGQKPRTDNQEGSFQVVDIVAAARPVTTWSISIDDPKNVASTVDEAFNRALSGRPGAVLVELPEDVASEPAGSAPQPITTPTAAAAAPETVRKAADILNKASQPVLLAGSGAVHPAVGDALTRFAEQTGIGVVAAQLGKGSLPESHDLSMRSLGIHRPDYAHLAIEPADVVLTVGYQPVEHPPLAWNSDEDKGIVHLAPWAAAIERGYQPVVQLTGDIAATLEALAGEISPRDTSRPGKIRATIEDLLAAEDPGDGWPPSPLHVVSAVRDAMGPADIVTLDNGAYKIWFARHFRTEVPNTLLLDNALATMGAGLGTAMAAARLHPDRNVLAVCGDGGFLMNVQALETATRMGLTLTVLVVRDDAYGFIEWHQDEQNRPNDGVYIGNPDLAELARAFGASAHVVDEDHPLESALTAALTEPGVSLIDCPLDYAMNEILSSDLYERVRKAYDEQ